MGSVKDLTSNLQVSLNTGEGMESLLVAETGPNLSSHSSEGGVSCEINSRAESPHLIASSEDKNAEDSSSCQPQKTGNNFRENSENMEKASRHLEQTSNAHTQESNGKQSGQPCLNEEAVQKDTPGNAEVTKVEAENTSSSAVPVNNHTVNDTLNTSSSLLPRQTRSTAIKDSKLNQQVMGINQDPAIKVTNNAPGYLIKEENIQEKTSERDSLNEQEKVKGNVTVLLDGSTVITNSKAIEHAERAALGTLHSETRKQNTKCTTKAQMSLQENNQEATLNKVQSPKTPVNQEVAVKPVTPKDETMQPDIKSASNTCPKKNANGDKLSGPLNVPTNSGLKESSPTQKTNPVLQVSVADEKTTDPSHNKGQTEQKQSGGNKLKARCLSESDAKTKALDNSFKESKGLAVPQPSFMSPQTLATSTQHAEIQVSLEVLCISAATSPMTPPEGCAAFFFPYSSAKAALAAAELGNISKKDAELQVGEQIESRSVATAPMSPLSLTAEASYPEIQIKGVTEDDQPEPVREVRWDEKGMTWEVYGASMEVEVLGMAIQKHLEKQIEEHGKSPAPQAGPPNSVVTRTSSLKGPVKAAAGQELKRRHRNPFRVMLQSVRRPRCCSRANTIE
ncbi:G protein regulated inducer of neurite outgrowth 1 [Amia ocellicauda]|uniref:G protein regulated inducer of neurite outgrowth 1 n=1 Tax=Amia ocellicauda TaxID=2972642 RepID=UPI0034638E73